MKIEQRTEGAIERKLLIAMIVNKTVLGRITPKWEKDGLFKNRWCNIIGGWCVKYFTKYGKAPNKSIENLFTHWAAKADKDTATLIEKFLGHLSDEWDQLTTGLNPDHLLDIAVTHFNDIKHIKLSRDLEACVEAGKREDAAKMINTFAPIELGETETVDVLSDQAALREAFEEKSESIIVYPGCLGDFFGSSLERSGFIAFEAPDKTGKSFWMNSISWEGMLQRKRVAHFVIGDMSKGQVLRRFIPRAAGRPLMSTKDKPPVKYPKAIIYEPGEEHASVDVLERHFKKDMDWREAWSAFEKVAQMKVKSKKPYLKLSCHPAGSISALGIQNILQGWERFGWTPDIIVIDYADNLAPINGTEESRHQVNRTWQYLSNLRQSMHCLVVTATQASAAAYDAKLITRKHFSENKMKNAHVTGMIGINQTLDERDLDITRLNWVIPHRSEQASSKVVHVAGCRAIGNIAVKSCY
jgi:hypothetical protein